jgi:hypothetical protein
LVNNPFQRVSAAIQEWRQILDHYAWKPFRG